jgi:hypothetical protein
MEFLIIGAIAAIAGTAKLILDANPEPKGQEPPALSEFPTAQVRGPRLAEIKRVGQLSNPEELHSYIEYLESQLARLGAPPLPSIARFDDLPFPTVPHPHPQTAVTQSVQGVPHVPQGSSPQVPQGVPQGSSPQVPQGDGEFGDDAIDAVFELLESDPNITKSQIAFQVWGLTRADKSGSPASRWQKAMTIIDTCLGEIAQATATENRHNLSVILGGKVS